jgi:hypothetical protein
VLPLRALWAHGSLALGDYQPGRSDLDLIALTDTPPGPDQRGDLERMHQALERREPLADKLHCSYLVTAEAADPARDHLTWAHRELFARPVTPVTRRELLTGGLVLLGPVPGTVLPPVTDAELAAFVRADLREYWYEHTAVPELWREDIWVDLGLLTFARASVTLAEGRLITKREALGRTGVAGPRLPAGGDRGRAGMAGRPERVMTAAEPGPAAPVRRRWASAGGGRFGGRRRARCAAGFRTLPAPVGPCRPGMPRAGCWPLVRVDPRPPLIPVHREHRGGPHLGPQGREEGVAGVLEVRSRQACVPRSAP